MLHLKILKTGWPLILHSTENKFSASVQFIISNKHASSYLWIYTAFTCFWTHTEVKIKCLFWSIKILKNYQFILAIPPRTNWTCWIQLRYFRTECKKKKKTTNCKVKKNNNWFKKHKTYLLIRSNYSTDLKKQLDTGNDGICWSQLLSKSNRANKSVLSFYEDLLNSVWKSGKIHALKTS